MHEARYAAMAVLLGALAAPTHAAEVGQVYTLSNQVAGNQLLVFERGADGTLAPAGAIDTGGLGTGAGLGNQGAIAVSRGGRWLLAVNAGSDSVSVFELTPAGPVLRDVTPSGGTLPISVAIDRRRVYVLNAGGNVGGVDTVTAFDLGSDGILQAIPGATSGLSAASTGPAQVGFAAHGDVLVVTEKATNLIDTFLVAMDGTLDGPVPHPSAGQTPFGFSVSRDRWLVVSEAAGGAPGMSSVSSYEVRSDGSLFPITSALPTGQTAACWAATSRDGRFAFLTNTGSSTVSGLDLGTHGELALLGTVASTGMGSAPIDLAFSRNGQYVYVLSGGTNTITGFEVSRRDGALAHVTTVIGLPTGSTGLAAR